MNRDARRSIEQDSARAVTAFFSALDARDYQKQWDQMTRDGCWNRSGEALDSRETFLAAMARRPAHLTIRHMITNLLVDVADDGASAVATFNIMVHVFEGDRGDKPAPMAPPSAISAFRAQLRPVGEDWRIAHLDYDVLFRN